MSGKLPPLHLPEFRATPMPPSCTQAQRDQAIAWLLRRRESPQDASVQRDFSAWLAADPAHPQAYRQAERQWAWMRQFEGQGFQARDEALSYRPRRAGHRCAAFATAASLLLVAGWALFSPQGWYGLPHSYATGKSQRLTVALADGSNLELNADSEVRVRYNRFRRRVELVRGEAFFSVRHDAARPFSVHTDNAVVRDIGTAFDVYKQARQTSVTVLEGVVELEGGGERKQLAAGQQLAYSNDGGFQALPHSDPAGATAWRQGLLVFRGRRLADVVSEISRYHDVDIRLPDPKLAELRVNGSFRTEQLDALLNAVATLLPVNIIRLSEREIVLEPTGKAR
ncbi:iron dicitrate transport regulator FecR [Methylomonas koyamae]|uniref:Iron dicitrate transport regulator FecR n=2 Tax=Methylomonas koyamae TaxID=702114 RepID=A0AA91DBC2_9GAMM|nr:iron dicitrate transport regulator FecR [Methylomonas koyamae]